MSRTGWRGRVYKWHRRLGVVLGLFWLWMAVTGFLINHARDFGFDRTMVENARILGWYGLTPPVRVPVGALIATLTPEGLEWGDRPLGPCSRLLGVTALTNGFLAACPERLILSDRQGALADQLDAAHGLVIAPEALGREGDRLLVRDSDGKVHAVNPDLLEIATATLPDTRSASWLTPREPSVGITRERLLQDLHAFRFAGPLSPWLPDVLAASTLLLAGSGWVLARKKRYKLHRH